MAQVVLSAAGSAVGGPVGGAIGATVGALLDRAAIESLRPAREIGPRLTSLQVMSAAEGAPAPAVFGRARIAGQVIWAARFKALRVERRQGGGKGGPRTVEEAYSLSFAVALGDGPIDGVGRIWADGKPMDLGGVTMRVHLGDEEQAVDPLIAAVEDSAPAYRGTAYAVFEDLPLGAFGNRVPQLSFEVFRRPRGQTPGLEERLEGVCLIPGAGEFVYATEPVLRREGLTRVKAENINNTEGRPDLLVSLDQLGAQLPKVKSVTLVVSWFGDDLRAGVCQVRPGVEGGERDTLPFAWRAGGVDRSGARDLADAEGRLAYGGTPADRTVIQAIAELKARGYAVTLYPFIMMDVRPGNGLPDPYGAAEQPAFPWRGRISCHPAPLVAGSPDGTAAAAEQVAAFFGQAEAAQFTVADGEVRHSGAHWSWSRMVLHYARLAELAGGVDGFLIGSEFRGLTWVRDPVGGYPAVAALRRLAGECRKVLAPETAISYAADWSEWFGHQPPDGSGDVAFHLDPLWSDAAIDFIGIDWYPPAADWRDGNDHLDARAGFGGTHDPNYLLAGVAGGEGFDWFYASPQDRSAQVRTPITDGAYGEPWVFRPKDIVSWWSNLHYDRAGGVRASTPTAWAPRSKPVRFVEFGAPAVDKGANSPNLFYDPKSSESGLPPFSSGARDDLGQRRALEAVLTHFGDPARNPVSDVYAGPMLVGMSAWCWDARPFPDFPGRPQVWADAPNWTFGHWLNGRAGVAPAAELIAAVLARGGVRPDELDVSQATGGVSGYVIDRPMALREALAPLLEVFGLDAVERGARLAVVGRDGPASLTLGSNDLAWPEALEQGGRHARQLDVAPTSARARFIDDAGEYQLAAATVLAERPGRGGAVSLDLPVVLGRALAEDVAARRLRRLAAEADEGVVHLSPEAALRLEPGDRVRIRGEGPVWRIVSLEADDAAKAKLVRAEDPQGLCYGAEPSEWRPGEILEPAAPPTIHLLDLPPLPGRTNASGGGPLAAVAGDPWREVQVLAGVGADALTLRGTAVEPAGVGHTLTDLPHGFPHRLCRGADLRVRVEGAPLQSRTWTEVASGANALAIRHPGGEWEVLQFIEAVLAGPETYTLRRLLRGQVGTDGALAEACPAGAPVVLLDEALVRLEAGVAERGEPLLWRATPLEARHSMFSTDTRFVWRGLEARPWSPARLRGRRTPGGGIGFEWIRRARTGGDGWSGETPLVEDQELYRLDIGVDGAAIRTWEVDAPMLVYEPEAIAADFPAGLPEVLEVEVRQGSPTFGWGVPTRRELLL